MTYYKSHIPYKNILANEDAQNVKKVYKKDVKKIDETRSPLDENYPQCAYEYGGIRCPMPGRFTKTAYSNRWICEQHYKAADHEKYSIMQQCIEYANRILTRRILEV